MAHQYVLADKFPVFLVVRKFPWFSNAETQRNPGRKRADCLWKGSADGTCNFYPHSQEPVTDEADTGHVTECQAKPECPDPLPED